MIRNTFVKLSLFVLIALALTACAHKDVSVCRHNSVFSAILHKAEHVSDEVVICLGYNKDRDEWNAQTKYKKAGEDWVFLKQLPRFTNQSSTQDDFEIIEEFSIEEWLVIYLNVLDKTNKE